MNETVTQCLLAMPEPRTGKQQGVPKLSEIYAKVEPVGEQLCSDRVLECAAVMLHGQKSKIGEVFCFARR